MFVPLGATRELALPGLPEPVPPDVTPRCARSDETRALGLREEAGPPLFGLGRRERARLGPPGVDLLVFVVVPLQDRFIIDK